MRTTKYNRKFSAFASGVVDRLTQRPTLRPVSERVRLDGRVCLVTGANRGLGRAVAVDLAKRGAEVLMACRSGHPDAGEDVRRLADSNAVDMLHVDLADLDSVHALCDRLERERRRVDVLVLNAGVMPAKARRSAQGYELMFAVHFLANRVLIDRLLAGGTIRPADRDGGIPRIVFIVSETHRAADSIDFGNFAAFTDYGLKDGLKYYASSKLHLCTYAQELSRRLNPEGEVRIAVNSLCPGAVDSDLMREAPWFLKPLLHVAKRLLFAAPDKAVAPVVHACCAEDMGRRSGVYLHLMREKEMSAPAMDAAAGSRLWRESEALLARHPRPGEESPRGLVTGESE
ncbi:MAG: SDR family NAD(P)-dependent oxidoreductase [Gemmatimonadales bacterium]|nr:SDR family NAD(P)-dependent oxidoreductase [Gemmatimonadales bacterium]MYL05312.1 SDR family NAD(P)-dependent oxidoreductase [Gemmatimonadales bacterium]